MLRPSNDVPFLGRELTRTERIQASMVAGMFAVVGFPLTIVIVTAVLQLF